MKRNVETSLAGNEPREKVNHAELLLKSSVPPQVQLILEVDLPRFFSLFPPSERKEMRARLTPALSLSLSPSISLSLSLSLPGCLVFEREYEMIEERRLDHPLSLVSFKDLPKSCYFSA